MHDDRKCRNMTRVLLVVAVLASSLAGCNDGSSTEDQKGSGRGGGGGGRLRIACQLDIEKLCAKEEHPRQCLTGHEKVLSPLCKAALEDRGNPK